jgi:zinc/manganese transport system permease protein
MWSGLTLAYVVPKMPPSFGILAVATGAYLAAFAVTSARERWRIRQSAMPTLADDLRVS